MAIPRQLIVIAASAAAAGVVLYARNRMREKEERERAGKRSTPPSGGTAPESGAGGGATPGATAQSAATAAGEGVTGARKELSLFLAGESWYDEAGWQGIWDREGIAPPEDWLRTTGKDVLASERKKLAEHPALLAGCRRRWIVVCRYAGMDVGDSAALWNATE